MENETRERHNQQMRNCREEARTEQLRLEQQWKVALQQKSELEAGQQIMSDQLKTLKDLKQKDDAEHSDVLKNFKRQMQELKDDFQQKKDKYEEQAKEIARSQKQAVSEFEKEKALMKQKIEHLEKTIEDKNNREKEFTVDWRTQKTGIAQEVKAVTIKHEAEIKTLMSQIDEEKDKSSELESKLAEKSQKCEALKERLIDLETSFKSQLSEAQSTIKDLMESKNQIKQETMNQLSSKLHQSQVEHQLQKQVIDELERKLKEGSEQLLQATHESRKQVAMRDQKIEFLDMQLKDLKEQLDESQRQHAHMVKTLNARNSNSDDETDAREKLELLQKEFTAMNEVHSNQVKDLQAEVSNWKQKLAMQETTSKEKLSDVQVLLQDAQTQLKEFEQKTSDLKERLKQLETTRSKLTDEQKNQEQLFKSRLEQELADHEELFRNEIKELQTRHDEQITQLKSFYDLEKDKIELRINEEKERSQRKIANLQEEQEARYREECRDKDDEIEQLNQQLLEMEQHQQSFSTQAEHEISLKQMQIEGLERQTADLKERLNKLESTRINAFDKQLLNFEQQRQELNSRVDKLMQENLAKDKQLVTVTNQMERTTETMQKRTNEAEQTVQQLERERQLLADRCEQQKIALSEMQDDAMQTKLEAGREIALLTQQVEFLNQKIDDLQRSGEESQRMFEEKLKVIRQEIYEDSQAQVDRVTQEKELWEQKYEQKRKALKDLETTLGRKISELEKQSNIQQSSIHKLEHERQTLKLQYAEEVSRLQQQLISNDGQNQQHLYGTVTTEELLGMKNQLTETERELADLQSTYDRDKALWEGKVQFLEQQKDNYKKDMLESQRKFEITLDQLQKRGHANKERQENSQQAILKVLESKYKAQIKELIESQQASTNEQKEKCKRLEGELASANERISAQGKSKGDEVGSLEKKLQEIRQNESRLQTALNDTQNELTRKVEDLQIQLQKDKDAFRARLADAEKKAKDAESKRAQMLFSIEKERANWQLEEDHFRRKQAELEEFIQNLERGKETLKKEISKLKSDIRGNSAAGPKKQFTLNKGSTHILNQTATSIQSQLPMKAAVNRSGSFTQDQVSADVATQNSSNGISQGSIVAARQKENEVTSYTDLTKSTSSMDMKQRQMASPDVMRMTQKSPLLVNRGAQQMKASMPPRQPLISGSLSSYNTTSQPQDNLSNNGSAAGQGFKLNLPNRYSSQEPKTNE